MPTVYGMSSSGNCYKVRLLLEQLGAPYDWRETDIMKAETRTPAYLRDVNANGKVPAIVLDDGRRLAESNAILAYLAEGTRFWPGDRFARAEALQWMFFEQYSHEPYVAVARFIRIFLPADSPRVAEMPRLLERGHQALGVMERHLEHHDFFAGGAYSIADIALFAYTHRAGDGDFDMSPYPAINAWLERVRAQPRFVEMRPS
jgi:glutathione S-transferase